MKRNIKIIYEIIVLISLLTGIILDILDKDLIIISSYFTLQSNILCFIILFIFLILELKKVQYKGRVYYVLKGAITIAIILTMTVYHANFQFDGLLLKGIDDGEISTFLLHTLSPILVVLDYIIFDEKGNFKLYYPALWIIIPSLYVIYVYIYIHILVGDFIV